MLNVSIRLILKFAAISLFFSQANAQVDMSAPAMAKRLLERFAGSKVPGDDPLLIQIVPMVAAGNMQGAADIASTHPGFLNNTVKHMALQMSTRDETLLTPLNDFTATIIGVVRDGTDARELLTGNFTYQADPTRIPTGITVRSNGTTDIAQSNNHYADMDRRDIDLGVVLRKVSPQILQSTVTRGLVPNPDPAGLITTRTFLSEHAVAGTNRRPVEYMFREFLCTPLSGVADITASDNRAGRDVTRFPGGSNLTYETTCKGCHTQHDAMRGAFAKWDFPANVAINLNAEPAGSNVNGFTNGVVAKMNRNSTEFPFGYVTTNTSWINNTTGASNMSMIGWRGAYQMGSDVKSLAAAFANSERFSQCMVKRVYDTVCSSGFDIAAALPYTKDIATRFEQSGYNMKQLFSIVAASKECGL